MNKKDFKQFRELKYRTLSNTPLPVFLSDRQARAAWDFVQTLLDEARRDEAKRAHRRFKKANTCSAGDLCDRDQCCSEGSVTIADVNAELEKLKNRISKLKDETTTDS